MFKKIRERKERWQKQHSFDYQMLSRLQSDCEYFLNHGNGNVDALWAGSVEKQILKMKKIYKGLKYKPVWLTKRQIKEYEKQMLNYKEV